MKITASSATAISSRQEYRPKLVFAGCRLKTVSSVEKKTFSLEKE
jgi:hypothetical protein